MTKYEVYTKICYLGIMFCTIGFGVFGYYAWYYGKKGDKVDKKQSSIAPMVITPHTVPNNINKGNDNSIVIGNSNTTVTGNNNNKITAEKMVNDNLNNSGGNNFAGNNYGNFTQNNTTNNFINKAPNRTLSNEDREILNKVNVSETIEITYIFNDREVVNYVNEIKQYLISKGVKKIIENENFSFQADYGDHLEFYQKAKESFVIGHYSDQNLYFIHVQSQ